MLVVAMVAYRDGGDVQGKRKKEKDLGLQKDMQKGKKEVEKYNFLPPKMELNKIKNEMAKKEKIAGNNIKINGRNLIKLLPGLKLFSKFFHLEISFSQPFLLLFLFLCPFLFCYSFCQPSIFFLLFYFLSFFNRIFPSFLSFILFPSFLLPFIY